MTLIANVLTYLRTSKNVVTYISKNYKFRVPLEKQHGKRAQTLLKSEWWHVYHIYWSLWRQLSLKKSLLVIRNTFRLFINKFLVYGKYPVLNREFLTQTIHMQLSLKQNTFSKFLSSFLKSRFAPKHCSYLNDGSFTIFIYYCKRN